jgi:signal transduction histidine kinase/ligand-binding sensor domain-containing protein
MRLFFVVGIIVFNLFQLPAQTTFFKHYSVNNGLSQSTVYHIYQDKVGLMWFATSDGLNCYNGNEFKTYKLNELQFKQSNFYGNNCVEDEVGNIYFSGRTGIIKYDRILDKVLVFHPSSNMDAFVGMMEVVTIKDSLLWFFNCFDAFYSYHLQTKKLTRVKLPDEHIHAGRSKLVSIDNENRIWYTIRNGVGCLDLNSNLYSTHLTQIPKHTETTYFNNCIQLNDSVLVFNFYNYILQYNIKQKTYDYVVAPHKDYNFICLTKYGNDFFVGTFNKGLWRISEQGRITKYTKQPQFDFGPATNIIITLFKDKSNNVWMGTDGYGVSKMNTQATKFNLFRFTNDEANTLSEKNFIKCFSSHGNEVWFGTHQGGVNIFNKHTFDVYELKYRNQAFKTVSSISNVLQDYMLVGSDVGVSLVHKTTKHVSHLPFTNKVQMQEGKSLITSFLRLKNGNLYATGLRGLYKINQKNGVPISVTRIDSFAQTYLVSAIQNKDEYIWIGGVEYLYVYKCKEDQNGTLQLIDTFLKGVNVRAFSVDDNENLLWMASEYGLIKYNIATNSYQIINHKNGLVDDHLYGIAKHRNELWLSSNKGLMCYDKLQKSIKSYTSDDGLQSNEFNTGSYYKAPDGYMYFGGINGFNYFHPDSIRLNHFAPSVIISELLVNNHSFNRLNTTDNYATLTFPYDSNTITFKLAALEFTEEDKNTYQYKLEGVDDDWVYSGTNNIIRYTQLKPGNYQLYAKAANRDGVFGDERLLCTIIIKQPWWGKWWFKVSLSLCVVGLFAFVIKFISQRKLKAQIYELEKKEAINKERARISKDMHDDLGSGLTKISILSQLLKKQYELQNEVHIEKIAKTSNELISNMSHIIWAMNPDNDYVENVLAYFREYVLEFFTNTPIRCTVNFSEEIYEAKLNQIQRRNLFLVYKECLNNTLKHAHASHVDICGYIDENKLILNIKDDGKGMDTSQLRKFGNGISNMHKRMKVAHGNCIIHSEINKGTQTTLTIYLNE